jgi:hypothetical protein
VLAVVKVNGTVTDACGVQGPVVAAESSTL